MSTIKEVTIPDIGTDSAVDVIEVSVAVGKKINKEDSLITLESDKATMEIPSPYSGEVKELKVKVGDKVSKGTLILTMEATDAEASTSAAKEEKSTAGTTKTSVPEKSSVAAANSTQSTTPAGQGTAATISTPTSLPSSTALSAPAPVTSGAPAHASPSVRRFARELGVELSFVRGTGRKNRIVKEDVQLYVKTQLATMRSGGGGSGLPAPPVVDFSKFGEIEIQALSKIKRLTGVNLHRNWVLVPHVTQFEEADITELEAFRQAQKSRAEAEGVKLTLLAFLIKAVVAGLKAFPRFNASLDASGEQLILKKYFHIGVAVDTPDGLVVPVLRDADKKGLFDLAKELAIVSEKARNKLLLPADMQGSCFTISSLGGIGGTAFTPIINAPDVAILGVSKSSMKPVYQDGTFIPRLLLPLSLSYDHRVIDGAEGARFTNYLSALLSDIRRLLL